MMKLAVPYVLSDADFAIFARMLESGKMPFGYASNLEKHIRNKKYRALKSHNYHVLMQQLMPLALRGLLQTGRRMANVQGILENLHKSIQSSRAPVVGGGFGIEHGLAQDGVYPFIL